MNAREIRRQLTAITISAGKLEEELNKLDSLMAKQHQNLGKAGGLTKHLRNMERSVNEVWGPLSDSIDLLKEENI